MACVCVCVCYLTYCCGVFLVKKTSFFFFGGFAFLITTKLKVALSSMAVRMYVGTDVTYLYMNKCVFLSFNHEHYFELVHARTYYYMYVYIAGRHQYGCI